jgi:acetyltransferase
LKLEKILNPTSVAVIGASREPEKVGHRLLRNIVEGGFRGSIYPVNPNAEEILGLKCYKNVLEVPGEVDLAVLSVPAKLVPTVARECGEKGVRGLIVISAGFGETGAEGLRLERETVDVCKRYGMRLQGPNCLGLINTRQGLNATFAGAAPAKGRIALLSQSGALGSAMLNWALEKKLGFTYFVSLGNEADLSAADFLEVLAEDDETRVIGMYIEGTKNGQRFMDVCAKTSRKKPVVVLKSGTTESGMKAVSSHTGSLAGSDTAFTAACRKAGIIRASNLEELFNLLRGFGSLPPMRGKDVLIFTNGGGPGILATDACEKASLEIPVMEEEILLELGKLLPPHASIHNPVDILGDADEKRYRSGLDIALSSSKIAGAIVIVTPQAMTPVREIASAIVEVCSRHPDKTVLPVFMGVTGEPIEILEKNGLPNYEFPEAAALVLSGMYKYEQFRSSPESRPVTFEDIDHDQIKRIIEGAKKEGRVRLTIEECMKVARACNIKTPDMIVARNADEAVEAAEHVGYPVAMKIVSPDIVHKTDLGGVVLRVARAEDVRKNYEEMVGRIRTTVPGSRIHGVMIQAMAPPGKEVIIGAVRDPQFGPLLMFGLGGIYVDFLRDVAYALCPLSASEAEEMIRETKAHTLLRGVRGERASDVKSVVETILRISQVITEFSDILEMEINPLIVYEEGKGCLAIDIRMTISQ